jgi:hypothetical protein
VKGISIEIFVSNLLFDGVGSERVSVWSGERNGDAV